MITVYSYAVQILTTNRTDSLQYTALIAAYKACPTYGARTRYLSLPTPDVIQCAIGNCFNCIPVGLHGNRLRFVNRIASIKKNIMFANISFATKRNVLRVKSEPCSE